MKNMYSFLGCMLFLTFSFSSFSQRAPMKYGKVPDKDVKMTVYPEDSTAEAAILCDYGVFDPNEFLFTRYMRIKILKKTGYHWADIVINNSTTGVKGKTFNYENGDVIVDKLKRESIFKERVTDNYYRTRISMPNVKEGSVIDVVYTIETVPFVWKFQDKIPIRWSEIRIKPSSYITIEKNFTGYQFLSEASDWRWVAKDMPAVREEPYVNSINNYIAKLEMEIGNINIHNASVSAFKSFTDSWSSVNNFLIEDDDFGGQLGLSLFLGDDKRYIEDLNLEGKEKLMAAYELIKSKIKWNEKEALFASSDLSNAYKERSGNAADINLTLCALLQKLDFNAVPVVLSTRENGLLAPHFPSIRKLDYTIVMVIVDNKRILLDATDEFLPMGMLPLRCLNESGRSIQYENTNWIPIQPQHKSEKMVLSTLTLKEDGSITGSLDSKYKGYAAYNFRKDYHSFNSEAAFIEDIEKENTGLQVEELKLDNLKDLYKPIVCHMEVMMENQAEAIGDMIYINPMVTEKLEENPFKLNTRKYPVNLPYPIEKRFIVNFQVPAGYTIEKIPESIKLSLPENAGHFIYQIQASGTKVALMYTLQLNKMYYSPTDYQVIKEFYKNLYDKHNEMIVLKKEEAVVQN